MKKTLISMLVLTTFSSIAFAQTPPVVATPIITTAPASSPSNKPIDNVNPFTGTSKTEIDLKKEIEEVKKMKALSQERLSLKRDEIEALKLDLEQKKLLLQLNPPKVEPLPLAVSNKSNNTSRQENEITVKKNNRIRQSSNMDSKPVEVKKVAAPPQIISPAPTKFETPQLISVIDLDGQKFATLKFDNKTLNVQIGSQVGGKSITNISSNGIQWGSNFLSVSSDKNVPVVAITDRKGLTPAPVQTPPVAAAPVNPMSYTPQPITITSNGAVNTLSRGSSSTTGVLLPPPPPINNPPMNNRN